LITVPFTFIAQPAPSLAQKYVFTSTLTRLQHHDVYMDQATITPRKLQLIAARGLFTLTWRRWHPESPTVTTSISSRDLACRYTEIAGAPVVGARTPSPSYPTRTSHHRSGGRHHVTTGDDCQPTARARLPQLPRHARARYLSVSPWSFPASAALMAANRPRPAEAGTFNERRILRRRLSERAPA